MTRLAPFLALSLTLVSFQSASAQSLDSWVGKRAIITRSKSKIYESIENPAALKIVGEVNEAYVTVDRDERGYLYVRSLGTKGWVNKSEFRLMDTAIPYFTERIERNPKDALAISMRAILWKDKKDYDKALADYDAVIRLEPTNATNYHNRGAMRASKNQHEQAIADFSEAIRIKPDHLLAHLLRGESYHTLKEYDKALADFNRAIEINPKYANLYTQRGNAWAAKKDDARAVFDFSRAIEIDPKEALAYRYRGQAYARAKEYGNALKDYDEAVRISPKSAPVRADLAWLLATSPDDKIRNGEKAIVHAKAACELTHWKAPGYLSTLAAAYAEAGDFQEAIRYQDQALAEFPEYAQNYGVRARQRLKLYEAGKAFHEK